MLIFFIKIPLILSLIHTLKNKIMWWSVNSSFHVFTLSRVFENLHLLEKYRLLKFFILLLPDLRVLALFWWLQIFKAFLVFYMWIGSPTLSFWKLYIVSCFFLYNLQNFKPLRVFDDLVLVENFIVLWFPSN